MVKMNNEIHISDKKYNIIYIDPPYKYNARNNKSTKFGGGTPYPTMPIWNKYNKSGELVEQGIEDFDVPSIADTNCALCMWVTFPYLDEGIKLFKHWGFDYKTILFNWVKTNPKSGWVFFGPGYYTASNTEICLLGVKGKMKPVSNYVSSVIISPREKHSKKPSEARDRIVELFGALPRIEIFARQDLRNIGWDVFGNEINTI